MPDPTPDEVRRVMNYLIGESGASARSARQSRSSFFGWLREQGLGYIVGKLVDYAWSTIRRMFGF